MPLQILSKKKKKASSALFSVWCSQRISGSCECRRRTGGGPYWVENNSICNPPFPSIPLCATAAIVSVLCIMYICTLHTHNGGCSRWWKLKHSFIIFVSRSVIHSFRRDWSAAHNNPYGRSSDHNIWKRHFFLWALASFSPVSVCFPTESEWHDLTTDGATQSRAVIAVSIGLAPAATSTN